MAEPFDIRIDTDSASAMYWYLGDLEYQNEEYPFSICKGDDGSFIELTWIEDTPPDDILEEVEKQIRDNF